MARKKTSPSSPYDEPAKLLTNLWKHHKSIQALAYDAKGNLLVSKQSFAVASQVLQYTSDITNALQQVDEELDYNNKALLYILIYERFLSERRKIRGGGALVRLVKRHASILGPALAPVVQQRSAQATTHSNNERYVRINTCIIEPTACVEKLQAFLPQQQQQQQIYTDPYVPHLLVVPRSMTAAVQRELGPAAVLQSQPSCFPAYCLSQYHNGGSVLDACAAPGNKTTHLAAVLPTTTRIRAWDRDAERCEVLQRRCHELVPPPNDNDDDDDPTARIQVEHTDYLATPIPNDVVSILLDPSCSGHHDCDESRIAALAAFQTKALTKALACDHVTTVVYSTCSTRVEENEHVVANVLAAQKGGGWTLVPVIPQWTARRGIVGDRRTDTNTSTKDEEGRQAQLTKEQAECLLRVDASKSSDPQQRGFFVACFVRQKAKAKRRRVDVDWTVPQLASLPVYNGESLRSGSSDSGASGYSGDTMDKTSAGAANTVAAPSQADASNQVAAGAPIKANKSKLTKKRAKKMEWKRRQRDSKKARLHAQQGAATGATAGATDK